jgi:hypothetical protein
MTVMNIIAEINKVIYKPSMCRNLQTVSFENIERDFYSNGSFLLEVDSKNQFGVSWWVSAKRTRSYPYARVYDTLSFSGKKVTIIPVFKDEGSQGDRDFIQWDTISLMSLLQVYVIIGYYDSAIKSQRYDQKITKQRFDMEDIKLQLKDLITFQSDALHWNLLQADKAATTASKALTSYRKISQATGVIMHSEATVMNRIEGISFGAESFKRLSRNNAISAQYRESSTVQPHENVNPNEKASLTIQNYLGGQYFFTADEARIEGNNLKIVECKHTNKGNLPSKGDIKDALLKMVLFTNLENVFVDQKKYKPIPILKLTSNSKDHLSYKNKTIYKDLIVEASTNNFILSVYGLVDE